MRNVTRLTGMAVAALAFTASPAAAATELFGDLADWQAAVGSHSRDTAYGSNFADITALTLDDGTAISFGSDVNIRTIGDGWATWSGGYTGQVLFTNELSSLTATFLTPVSAFGFFAEPVDFSDFDITIVLSDGSTLTQSVNGSSGADFFGWAGGGITSYTISISGQSSFAFGDFYSAIGAQAVPEPGTWAMMLLGFGAIGLAVRRSRRRSLQAA